MTDNSKIIEKAVKWADLNVRLAVILDEINSEDEAGTKISRDIASDMWETAQSIMTICDSHMNRKG